MGKKLRYLERQWELIEGNKKLRLQIPTVISTLLIAISAFYIQFEDKEVLENRWLITSLIILILLFGILSLIIIH